MKKKQEDKKTLVQRLRKEAGRELQHWQALKKYGGNDPLWPDGTNMNLTRNHMIYANMQIAELANAPKQLWMFGEGIPLLDDLLISVPPEVSNDYMADVAGIKSRAGEALGAAENSSDPRIAKEAERLRKAMACRDYVDMRRITYSLMRECTGEQAIGGQP